MPPKLKLLQQILDKPFLVKKNENIFYLTGEKVIHGYLLVTKKSAVFFGDGMETVDSVKNDELKNIVKTLKSDIVLGFEDCLTVRELATIKKVIPKIKLQEAYGVVEALRFIKSASELSLIKQAVELTAEVFKEVRDVLRREIWTEQQLARFIRYTGIGLGAEDVSFEPIVAAGKNSSVPHHKPSKAIIKSGEPIVLDFGFKIGGYCSDFTRTVFLKKIPKDFGEIYTKTLLAYTSAFAGVRAGMSGKQVDKLARDVLFKNKLSKLFVHSLGHGTGLEVHEYPGVGPFSENVLENGMVFSIEPGVYKKGKGGVRIEDLVYLENGQAKQFVEVSRDLKDQLIA